MAIDPTSGALALVAIATVSGTTVLAAMDPGAAAFAITVVGTAAVGVLVLCGRELIKFMRDWRASQAGTVQEQLKEANARYEREAEARLALDSDNRFKSERIATLNNQLDKAREDRASDILEMHEQLVKLFDVFGRGNGFTNTAPTPIEHLADLHKND
jgi:hypothetical protein